MATMHLGKGAGKQGWGEWEDEWAEEWEDEQYFDGAGITGYYGQTWEDDSAGWDIFEIDLYSMVLTLDENLAPQDMYAGFEFDDKSFLMVLGAEDIEENVPAAWKSRPLRIHPEPAARIDKKAETSRATFGGVIDADGSGANTPTHGSGPATSQQPSPQMAGVAQAQHDSAPAAPSLPRLPDIGTPQRTNGSDPGADLRGSPEGSPKTPAQQGVDAAQAASALGAQSPKIFLSDNQLETLKQKMQLFKQKRSVTPMSLPPAHDEDAAEASPREKASENGTPKATGEPIVHSNCPQKHGLKLFKTPDPGWWCSVCEREHPKGAPFYGCRKCDYDECEPCALKSRTAPSSPKATVRGSPRASPRASPPRAASRSPLVGSKSASASPPIRRQVSSAKKEQHSSRRESKAQAQARQKSPEAAAPSDDSDVEEEEDEAEIDTPPKAKSRRRKHGEKTRSRRSAAAPDHWEPKEKNRSPPREAPLRRRRESATTKEKDTPAKKRAALERRTARSPSLRRSSSEEPPPKKRTKALPTSSESDEPPARKASLNARHKAAASPEVKKRAAKAADSSPETERAPLRKLGSAEHRPQRGITRGAGGNDFLRKVLQAGQETRPGARSSRTESAAVPRKELPVPEPKEPARKLKETPLPPREPRGQRAPRSALGIISSQIQQNSRRV